MSLPTIITRRVMLDVEIQGHTFSLTLDAARQLRHQITAAIEGGGYIKNRNSMQLIIEMVAVEFELHPESLQDACRISHINIPRQLAMYFCREFTSAALSAIGQFLGGRDHGTVLHGISATQDRLDTDPELKSRADRLRIQIKEAITEMLGPLNESTPSTP
jgi:chromosomal replication initiation ATPase DnaA